MRGGMAAGRSMGGDGGRGSMVSLWELSGGWSGSHGMSGEVFFKKKRGRLLLSGCEREKRKGGRRWGCGLGRLHSEKRKKE